MWAMGNMEVLLVFVEPPQIERKQCERIREGQLLFAASGLCGSMFADLGWKETGTGRFLRGLLAVDVLVGGLCCDAKRRQVV